jgi:anti-sigma regulatory factor (Ser/Thr protein kinase)
VHEAFVNAVRHGNRAKPDNVVVITLETGGSGENSFVEVRIRDCGDGFDPVEEFVAACSVERLDLSNGRGLLFIHHYTESLRVERLDGGCVLVLRYIPCRSITSDSLTS